MSGEERLVGMLARELRGRSPEEAARRLLARGLVARGACERWLLREEVERRIAAGAGCCEAMEAVAVELACSYGKVRNCYSQTFKSNHDEIGNSD